MAFWAWSRTAGNNATADSTINWAEGQSPSSVNDSARAMMARTADWRDDISGTITTGGTSTAFTVTSNQVFDTLAHMNGAMIAFVPHTTCGTPVTLNVDGLGAKPLRTSPSVEVGAASLIQGTPYVVTYNNSDAAFYLQNFFGSSFVVPVGGMIPYLGSTAPNSSFVLPFGQAISRATYATLFALVSTTFGVGDGTTTFNVPDLRGRAPFGLDNMGGSAASRIGTVVTDSATIVGTTIGSVGGSSTHILTIAETPAHSHGGVTGTLTGTFQGNSAAVSAGGNTRIQLSGAAGGDVTGNLVDVAFSATAPITSQGSGSAHAQLPPAIILPYILRVL